MHSYNCFYSNLNVSSNPSTWRVLKHGYLTTHPVTSQRPPSQTPDVLLFELNAGFSAEPRNNVATVDASEIIIDSHLRHRGQEPRTAYCHCTVIASNQAQKGDPILVSLSDFKYVFAAGFRRWQEVNQISIIKWPRENDSSIKHKEKHVHNFQINACTLL